MKDYKDSVLRRGRTAEVKIQETGARTTIRGEETGARTTIRGEETGTRTAIQGACKVRYFYVKDEINS